MMKRGQATVFIILGAIVLALIVLLYSFRENIVEEASKIEITRTIAMGEEAREVQADMEGCVKGVAELGLVVMGLQGGYATMGQKTRHTNTGTRVDYVPYEGTAYLYFQGQKLVPTKESMEKQIINFTITNMAICEKQYTDIDVTYGKMNGIAKVYDEKVSFEFDTDVKVRKGERESKIKTIDFQIPVRLGLIQKAASSIVSEQIKTSKTSVCMSCITRIASENDLEIGIDRVGEDIIYTITDKKSKIGNMDYVFMFANKF